MRNSCPIILSAIRNIDSEENMAIISENISGSTSTELYIDCSFNSSLNGFYGYDQKHTFELALKEFKDYCLDYFTKLKNNSDPKLLDKDPNKISIAIYTRDYLGKRDIDEYYERNQDVYQEYDDEDGRYSNYGKRNLFQLYLSIRDTLPTSTDPAGHLNSNDINLFIVLLLYLSQSNRTKSTISTFMDIKKHLPFHTDDMLQDELDRLIEFGYIDFDGSNSYIVNDLGKYFLKWKQPHSLIDYNF